ncbi:uncharacterized protein LOC141855553 [Brevipalpus obovatus]|uniref:uncharacterized protein LOC141855553 n=1 Tax=Brevipalpus obovatus TaxID=246614 RepID=UPI003D9E557B
MSTMRINLQYCGLTLCMCLVLVSSLTSSPPPPPPPPSLPTSVDTHDGAHEGEIATADSVAQLQNKSDRSSPPQLTTTKIEGHKIDSMEMSDSQEQIRMNERVLDGHGWDSASRTLPYPRFDGDSNENNDRWYEDTLQWCEKIRREFEIESRKTIQMIEEKMAKLFFIDQGEPIQIDGDLTFDQAVEVANTLVIFSQLSFPDDNVGDHVLNLRSLQVFKDAEKQLDTFMRVEKSLSQSLQNGLLLEGDQIVSGDLIVNDIQFTCGCYNCTVASIMTPILNDRHVHGPVMSRHLINTREDVSASLGHVPTTFNSMEIRSSLDAAQINGIRTSEIVTKSGHHQLAGELIFSHPDIKVDSLNVRDTINGHHVRSDTVLTHLGNQMIRGHVEFRGPVVAWNLNADCNSRQLGSNFKSFVNNIATRDQPFKLLGAIRFADLLIQNVTTLDEGNSLNGVDVVDVKKNMITKSTNQYLGPSITFDNLVIDGSLFTNSLNGASLRPENFVKRNSSDKVSTIRATKIFLSPLSVRNVRVERSLNHKPVHNGSLDLLLTRGTQVISGHKTMPRLVLEARSYIGNSIGGLDVHTWTRNRIQVGKSVKLSGGTVIDNLVVSSGLVNGLNVSNLYTNFLRINDPIIWQDFQLSRAIFRHPPQCSYMDSIHTSKRFLTKNTKQIIEQPITFMKPLLFNNHLRVYLINKVSLSSVIEDSLRDKVDQHITGSKTISGDLYVKKLNVKLLNSRPMTGALVLNEDETPRKPSASLNCSKLLQFSDDQQKIL